MANVNVPRNVSGWTAWRQTRKHPNLEPSPHSHRRKRNFLCFLTFTRDHEPSERRSVFPTLRPVRLGWARARSSTPGHSGAKAVPKAVAARILPPAPGVPFPGRAGSWRCRTGPWPSALRCREARLEPARERGGSSPVSPLPVLQEH